MPKATDTIRQLVTAREAAARTAQRLFPLVDKANEQPPPDLPTQRLDARETTAWMPRSLLEREFAVI